MTQRYAVPEEGLKAALDRFGSRHPFSEDIARMLLEAFIRWQSENPQVPTDEQCDELISLIGATGRSLVCYPSRIDRGQARTMLTEWQRRMYLADDFDPSLGGALSGRTFTQKQADAIKEYVQGAVHG